MNNIHGSAGTAAPCSPHSRAPLGGRVVAALTLAAALGSCATRPPASLPAPLRQPLSEQAAAAAPPTTAPAAPSASSTPARQTEIRALPAPPASAAPRAVAGPSARPSGEVADIAVNFDAMPLPQFIQVTFGNVLQRNFTVDAAVQQRQDLVTLRLSQPVTPGQLYDTARAVLKGYGVAVNDVGGFLRLSPDNTTAGYLPEIRRGRALPEVPEPLRPVFMLVELQAVRPGDVAGQLRTMFGNKLQIAEDPERASILLSGQGSDLRAALDAIAVLDQPLLRGRNSVRISPVYWAAEDMARRLQEILAAQGYRASIGAAAGSTVQPVILLPVPALNALLVFAASPQVIEHVAHWAQELDRPGKGGRGGGLFTYQVRHTDAQLLAATLRDLISGVAAAAAPAPAAAGQPLAAARPPASGGGRVVVNAATNTLIFQGSAEEYSQWLTLLQELDRPARSALIEVTVAEVRLNEGEQLGIEWAFNGGAGSGSTTGGTLGNLGTPGNSGLVIRYLRGADVRLLLQALATENRARVLSTPRIMARNGEAATIQVGQEVPIITSQQSSITGITTGVLQTVQYRSTGVILRVRPVIHSGGRVDLEISQEVSAAASTATGVNNSPTFTQRKVDTRLSLAEGATVLLGGLIGVTETRRESGVPLLKDIPGLGALFKNQGVDRERTELIVLITPYVIENDFEASSLTEAFRSRLGTWAAPATLEGASNDPKIFPSFTTNPRNPPFTAPPRNPLAPTPNTEPTDQNDASRAPWKMPRSDSAGRSTTEPPAAAQTPAASPPAAAIPGGTIVTDPAELEELRRAIQNAPATPSRTPDSGPQGSGNAGNAPGKPPGAPTSPAR